MMPDFFDRTLLEWAGYIILLSGFLLTLILQMGFYLRVVRFKKNNENEQMRPISVLLSIRNEQERIERILLELMEQDYPSYEVIVVDDYSEDATLTIVGVLAKKFPKIKFSSLNQETRFSEKMAINLALKAASNDWVVFLNPEVDKIEPNYLKRLNDGVTGKGNVIMHYSNFLQQKGFYNRWCRVERFSSFMTSASLCMVGMPLFYHQYNVLFHRQIYFGTDGFRGKINAHYANLELIFNHLKESKIDVSIDDVTILREKAEIKKSDFIEIVRKRILIRRDLPFVRKIIMMLEGLAKLLLIVGLIWLLIKEIKNWAIFSAPILLLILIHVFMVKIMLKHLNERKIFLSSLLYVWVRPVVSLYHRVLIYTHVQRNKWN